jgi:hypothetical protein
MTHLLFLSHWNQAEAQGFAAELRAGGWEVEWKAASDSRACRRVSELLPAAVIVDLSYLPSHGRITAEALQKGRSTRETPVVFVGGDAAALEKARAALPSSRFIAADELPCLLESLRSS